MTTVTVDLGPRSYAIQIGRGLLASAAGILAKVCPGERVGLISNPTVHKLYGQTLETSLSAAGYQVTRALVPDDEQAKELATVSRLYDTLIRAELDRTSIIVALGGGVVGDIAGFVAATLFRGLPYIQIPTTLLAMVDASIGGKTGVNHPQGKNLIGAFHQPRAVIIDPELLRTLPRREITSACAEIIKAAVVTDGDFFKQLARGIPKLVELTDLSFVEDTIVRACRIKAGIVAEDEQERALPGELGRRVLNFGHTIGHALEVTMGYGALRHGEAVAMGMVAAGHISVQEAGFSTDDLERLAEPLGHLQLPALPAIDKSEVRSILRHDKKVHHGALHFILLESLGRPIANSTVTDEQIDSALDHIQWRFN